MADQFDLPSEVGYVYVTPEMAQSWIDNLTMRENRKISRQTVLRYREVMEDGRWKKSPQGFAFNEDGQMIDGQHRLHALAGADIDGIEILIVPNSLDESFTVLDSGHRRQAAHIIDGPYKSTVAAAGKILHHLSTRPENGTRIGSGYVTNDLVVSSVEEWREELSKYAKASYTAKQLAGINPSTHLTVLAQVERTENAHMVPEWLEGIMTGAGLESGDSRLALRNRFLKDRKHLNGSSGGRVESYNLIVKAWNAFVLGKKVSYLRMVNQSAPPPKVIGYEF